MERVSVRNYLMMSVDIKADKCYIYSVLRSSKQGLQTKLYKCSRVYSLISMLKISASVMKILLSNLHGLQSECLDKTKKACCLCSGKRHVLILKQSIWHGVGIVKQGRKQRKVRSPLAILY